MSNTENELIKKLNRLMGQSLIDPRTSKHFLNPETREATLEKYNFEENEIKEIMNLEFESIEGFGKKAYEVFGISSDMGKERK